MNIMAGMYVVASWC